jgi:hypothetical protein
VLENPSALFLSGGHYDTYSLDACEFVDAQECMFGDPDDDGTAAPGGAAEKRRRHGDPELLDCLSQHAVVVEDTSSGQHDERLSWLAEQPLEPESQGLLSRQVLGSRQVDGGIRGRFAWARRP